MNTNQLVTIIDLAKRTGLHKTSVLRAMKQRGTKLYQLRDSSTGFHAASAVTAADTELFATERRSGVVVGAVETVEPDDFEEAALATIDRMVGELARLEVLLRQRIARRRSS